MPDPWFRTTQTLRFSDNDAVGHVNNAIYATLMEAGRTDLMHAAQLYADRDRVPVVVRLEIDFKREMTWPGTVLIETATTRIGGRSIAMTHRVSKEGVISAEGVSVIVLLDRATRRAVPIDSAIREQLAPWMLPGA